MNESLGLLEVKGLLGAITMADAMVKASNVHVVNIDRANGFGWFTVKIVGDVGAVQSAIQAGSSIAKEMNCFVGCKVIPRVSQSVVDVFLKDNQVKETIESNQKDSTLGNESIEVEDSTSILVESIIDNSSESPELVNTLQKEDIAIDESKDDTSLVEIIENVTEVQQPRKSTKSGKSKKKSNSKK